jgi:hypothetical protein
MKNGFVLDIIKTFFSTTLCPLVAQNTTICPGGTEVMG